MYFTQNNHTICPKKSNHVSFYRTTDGWDIHNFILGFYINNLPLRVVVTNDKRIPALNMLASVDKYSFREDAANDIQYSIRLTEYTLIQIVVLAFVNLFENNNLPSLVLCASVFFGYLLNTIFINKNINHEKFWQFYSLIVVSNTFLFFSP